MCDWICRFPRLLLLIMGFAVPAWGADGAGTKGESVTPATPVSEIEAAFTAAREVAQHGPTDVKLGEYAALKLPQGFVYIPPPASRRLLTAMGNHAGEGLLGMIFPSGDENANWLVVAQYYDSGYIKDDDAKDWNADELLANLRAGTEEANKDRKARGIGELEVVGWVEKPQYDGAAHRLVWSVATKDKAAPDTADKGINYNTYALGREGYISLNFVTDLASIEAQKPIAKQLLAALDYNDGKRYADFNADTDRIAEYGLAALVGGIAAKKLGMFALIAAFVAKFAKVIGVAVIALGAVLAKYFKRKSAAPRV